MRTVAVATTLLLGVLTPHLALAGDRRTVDSTGSVQVSDGKVTVEEVVRCKLTWPGFSEAWWQIRTYAEAPVSAGFSREFLVSFQSMSRTLMAVQIGASVATIGSTEVAATRVFEPWSAVDCTPVAPGGEIDVEISLYLTAVGYQRVVVDGTSGRTVRDSRDWDVVPAGL